MPHHQIAQSRRSRLAVELLQRRLDLNVVLPQLAQLDADGLEAVVVRLIAEARLVLAVAQVLDLLAAVAQVVEAERSRRALEEVPERRE